MACSKNKTATKLVSFTTNQQSILQHHVTKFVEGSRWMQKDLGKIVRIHEQQEMPKSGHYFKIPP
jgi:hypothetical protein